MSHYAILILRSIETKNVSTWAVRGAVHEELAVFKFYNVWFTRPKVEHGVICVTALPPDNITFINILSFFVLQAGELHYLCILNKEVLFPCIIDFVIVMIYGFFRGHVF